jgi:hypothetical protein
MTIEPGPGGAHTLFPRRRGGPNLWHFIRTTELSRTDESAHSAGLLMRRRFPMRKLAAGFLASLVAVAGCRHETPLGGPGAPRNTLEGRNQPVQTEEMFFSLTLPDLPVTVQRGKETHLTVGIRRGAKFTEKVRVEFARAPKGVTFSPSAGEILPKMDKLDVTVQASQGASPGETTVEVSGTPEALGKIARGSLRLKVE